MLIVNEPGPFRKITADDPSQACLLYLRALSSFQNIRDMVRQRHPTSPALNTGSLQRLNLWLNHALDYLHVARESASSSRYLIGYYGALNLSRFVVSIHDGYPSKEDH